MTATVQPKSGYWYIYVSWYVNRKRHQKWCKTGLKVSKYGRHSYKLEAIRLEKLQEYQELLELNGPEILFSDYLKIWLQDIRGTIEDATLVTYTQNVLNVICPYFEERRIKLYELKAYQIQDFYRYKMDSDHVSANTIRHYHANISKALNDAVRTERILTNPARLVRLPKVTKHVASTYTLKELRTLLDCAVGTTIEPAVMLAAWYGMRRGEVIGLKWEYVDFERNMLTVAGTMIDKCPNSEKKAQYYKPSAKTASSIRSFPLNDVSRAYLENLKYLQDERKKEPGYNHEWDEFVCVKENGDIITLDSVSSCFPDICKRAGLKRLTFHELRHTNISLLLESGASMKELQDWAGHSSYNLTANTYSHVQVDKSKKRLSKSMEHMLTEKEPAE